MALEVTLPAWLAGKGIDMYNKSQLGVDKPTDKSSIHFEDDLLDAADRRVAAIAPDASPLYVNIKHQKPDPNNSSMMAAHSAGFLADGTPASNVYINPNADAAYLAHELGHGISQKTKAGKFINDARHLFKKNPKLAKALAMSLPGATAFTGAALQEGNDDLGASLAIAAAAASPTLIDEALATKNAFAIMDDANMRATLGQRGRLAGGYLSYLAPVIIAGSVGNTLGNVADDYTALYDL